MSSLQGSAKSILMYMSSKEIKDYCKVKEELNFAFGEPNFFQVRAGPFLRLEDPERWTELRVRAACPWALSGIVILSRRPQFFIMGSALEGSRGILLVKRIDGNTVRILRMKVIRFSSSRFVKEKSFHRCID